jgi:hypothetical protein
LLPNVIWQNDVQKVGVASFNDTKSLCSNA